MERELRYKQIMKISLQNLILNLILAIAKVLIGIFGGSTAVLSDGINSSSDVLTTVIVMFSSNVSKNEDDNDHHYGHERIESLFSAVLAIILLGSSILMAFEGVKNLLRGGTTEVSFLAVVISVISIFTKEFMFRNTKKQADKLDSTNLLATAWDYRSDVFLSCAVLIGVVGAMFKISFLEPFATIVVSVIIFKVGLAIIKPAIAQLTDAAASTEDEKNIYSAALSIENVLGVDLLKTRQHGSFLYVDIEICVNSEMTVAQGHTIAEQVHNKIEECSSKIKHCMVHINPRCQKED